MAYVIPARRGASRRASKRRRSSTQVGEDGEAMTPATPAPATYIQYAHRPLTGPVVNIAFVNLQDATLVEGESNDPKIDLVKELLRFHDGVFIAEVLMNDTVPSFIYRIKAEVGHTHDFFKTQHLPQGPPGFSHGLFFIGKKSDFETDFYSSALAVDYVKIPQLAGKERILAVKHTAGDFLICGVHLKYGGDARDKQLRTQAVQTIIENMVGEKDGKRFLKAGVILGDFNIRPEDAKRLVADGRFTYDQSLMTTNAKDKVDHYFSRGVQILRGVIPRDYRGVTPISDHPSIRIRIQS